MAIDFVGLEKKLKLESYKDFEVQGSSNRNKYKVEGGYKIYRIGDRVKTVGGLLYENYALPVDIIGKHGVTEDELRLWIERGLVRARKNRKEGKEAIGRGEWRIHIGDVDCVLVVSGRKEYPTYGIETRGHRLFPIKKQMTKRWCVIGELVELSGRSEGEIRGWVGQGLVKFREKVDGVIELWIADVMSLALRRHDTQIISFKKKEIEDERRVRAYEEYLKCKDVSVVANVTGLRDTEVKYLRVEDKWEERIAILRRRELLEVEDKHIEGMKILLNDVEVLRKGIYKELVGVDGSVRVNVKPMDFVKLTELRLGLENQLSLPVNEVMESVIEVIMDIIGRHVDEGQRKAIAAEMEVVSESLYPTVIEVGV